MIKSCILITIVFIFLWSTGLSVGNIIIPVSLFLTYFIIFIFFFFKRKYFLKKLFDTVKYTPVKYLLLFILYTMLSSFLLTTQHNSFTICFRVIRDYLLFVAPFVFLPCLLIPNFLTLKKCINFIIVIYSILLLYASIDYLFQTFVPSVHLLLYSLICNVPKDNYMVLQRANGPFLEPTFLATFIFVFLPLFYKLYEQDYLFLFNKVKNKYFFRLIILLSWATLLLTKSPIYILAAIVLTAFFIKKSKKAMIICLLCLTLFIPIVCIHREHILNNNKVVVRIKNAVTSFADMEKLVLDEGSLATRIGLVHVAFSAAKKHPILGAGYANDKDLMYNQIIHSNFPLTDEIRQQNYKNGGLTISNIFLQTLCWTGVIGVFLLYSFILKTVLLVNRFRKYIQNKEEKTIITGLCYVSINYIICSVYWSLIADTVMWFMIGTLCSYIAFIKKELLKMKIRNNI